MRCVSTSISLLGNVQSVSSVVQHVIEASSGETETVFKAVSYMEGTPLISLSINTEWIFLMNYSRLSSYVSGTYLSI